MPTNVSQPRWICDICRTDHHRDYERAVACEALGTPDLPAVAADGNAFYWDGGTVVPVEAGPVRLDRNAGHVRDVTAGGRPVSLTGDRVTELLPGLYRAAERGGYRASSGPRTTTNPYTVHHSSYRLPGKTFGQIPAHLMPLAEMFGGEPFERLREVVPFEPYPAHGRGRQENRVGHAERSRFLFAYASVHGFRTGTEVELWEANCAEAIVNAARERYAAWASGEDVSVPANHQMFPASTKTNGGYVPATPGKARTALMREAFPELAGYRNTDLVETAARKFNNAIETENTPGLLHGVPTRLQFYTDRKRTP